MIRSGLGAPWPVVPQRPPEEELRRLQLALGCQKRCPGCGVLQPVANYATYGAHVVCRWCAARRDGR